MRSESKADIILTSNAVFTGKDNEPKEASIAIIKNKIAYVGPKDDVKVFIGPNTKIYDLGDKLIMPGFNDVHTHIILGCLLEDNVNLIEAKSAKDAARMVKNFAENRAEDEWILGFSWYHTYWEHQQVPHRDVLDEVLPERPVFLMHAAGHIGWVNTKALELLNIDRHTPDPLEGMIERDEDGEPTGILYESALSLVANLAYKLKREQKERIFTNFLRKAAQYGITSITDIFTLTGYEIDALDLYEEFNSKGKLTTRISFLTSLMDLERAKHLREKFHDERLQFSGLKEFLDGIVTAHTAYLVEPYENRLDTNGPKPSEEFLNHVLEADKEGFRIRFHAVGDGAVRYALDMFEEAQNKNGKRDSRHTIEHIEVIHPDDISRFEKLDVLPSMQPEHMGLIERNHYVSCIGEQREKYTFPLKSLISSGAKVILGSDYPIVDLNPMLEIYRAVTRIAGDGKPWNEEESITLSNALKAYTVDAAYGIFRENELGTLEEGKWADIIVLDKNLFTIPSIDITDVKVILTIMDGDIVFENVTQDAVV